jgi:CMP-N-acetylneuraminic acid synthetase
MDTKFTALLPMKANSQRVPGKNFRLLNGRPLYRWMLDTLLSIKEVERVIINTDASQLLHDPEFILDERVVVRERASTLRGDEVSMNKILADDVAWDDGKYFLMTHTTNPFLEATTIAQALKYFTRQLVSGECDSLFSVNRFQTRFYREDASPVNHDPQELLQTQDLEPWFEENSCLYLFTTESFSQTSARIGQHPVMFETPRSESLDIDTPEDWDLAEILAPLMSRRTVSSR